MGPERTAAANDVDDAYVGHPDRQVRDAGHRDIVPRPAHFHELTLRGGHPSDFAEDGHQAQSWDHPDRFTNDRPGHLARSLGSVDEYDRDLHDPEAALPGAEAHLDLKGIT